MGSTFFQSTDLPLKSGKDQNKFIQSDLLQSPQTLRRIPELDGLRAIAILMVISFHYINNQLINSSGFVAKILGKLTSFGWVGVDLFFVLSGFLIGSNLIGNKGSKNYFSTFYIRRVVRIIPNYYLLILLFSIICSIPFFSSDYFLTGNNVIPKWAYLLMIHNIFMAHLQNFGNISISITWSIGVEEQFYIIFPILVYYLKEKWLPYVLVLAIVIAPLIRMQFTNWIPAYVLLPCRMDSIAFGALIAYTNHSFSLTAIVKKWIVPIVLVLAVDCLICAYLYIRFSDLGVFKNTLFAILFSGLIIFALVYKNSIYGAVLRYRTLVWIGTISYSLYLFHDIILGLCHRIFSISGEGLFSNLKGISVSVLALIISIGFSWLVYKKLETPFVSWGKRFKY